MIDGVRVVPLKLIPDERGWLMEILRCDDELFMKFGQVYVTAAYPNVVKAWHCHRKQYDHFTVVAGMAKIVLYDGRDDSPTHGQFDEFFVGTHNHMLVRIPPLVWHGFKGVGPGQTLIVNCPTEPYNREDPDEMRLPPYDGSIPYDWSRKDG